MLALHMMSVLQMFKLLLEEFKVLELWKFKDMVTLVILQIGLYSTKNTQQSPHNQPSSQMASKAVAQVPPQQSNSSNYNHTKPT